MESKGIEILANPYGRKLTEQEIISHLNGVDGLLAGLEPLNENVFKDLLIGGNCIPNSSVIVKKQILEKIGFRYICHHYQYDETPYANPRKDYDKMKKDINLIANGKKEDISISPPFLGTMLSVLYQKI